MSRSVRSSSSVVAAMSPPASARAKPNPGGTGTRGAISTHLPAAAAATGPSSGAVSTTPAP